MTNTSTAHTSTAHPVYPANACLFNKVVFIGLGLIGASLAHDMRRLKLAGQIAAVARSSHTLQQAEALGLIDSGSHELADVIDGADLVVLAMPVGATHAVLQGLKPFVHERMLITDVGSTKGNVMAAALSVFGEPLPPGWLPGHPIAGAEHSGVLAGRADLFRGHKVILTPSPWTAEWACTRLTRLWQLTGAQVHTMSALQHDQVLARTSHLPHLLAFALVDQLIDRSDNLDLFRYAAGGFRDFTRIAASDPVMWHDIALANRDAILSGLRDYQAQLGRLIGLIETGYDEQGQAAELMGLLTRSQAARQHFTHMLNQTAYSSSLNPSSTLRNHDVTQQFICEPGGQLTGRMPIPGDKSVSHRAIMLGALANGVTDIEGFLEGEDALATLQAFRDMGVVIEGPRDGRVTVHGVGLHGLKAPAGPLYMGNSGTSMRLLSGILAAQPFDSVLTGDLSLSKRPMERIARPLRLMGANIQSTGEKGTPPLSIRGNPQLQGIHYELPMASAQVKSGVLLAGLWASGTTSVMEPEVTRDHTERMLQGFGYAVTVAERTASVTGGGQLTATAIRVPADISSAAFFMVGAAISAGSELVLEQVGINPTRTGVVEILRQMGADISLENHHLAGGEPVADIRIRASQLQGIHIPEDQVPLAIDEFPVLFVAAACARGQTVLTGAAELRVKESDRIAVMADGLQALGIDCTPTPDGMIIEGRGNDDLQTAIFNGGHIDSHHDHRIAMSFAIASLRASAPIHINGTETVATSFPNFVALAAHAGLRVTQQPG